MGRAPQHFRATPARRLPWKMAVLAASLAIAAGSSLLLRDGEPVANAQIHPVVPEVVDSVATPRFEPVALTSTTLSVATSTSEPAHPFVVAVGAPLPTAAECAKRVVKTRETKSTNSAANRTMGKVTTATNGNWGTNAGANKLMQRVDGRYTGTTDEIIQWASCKWGMDPDQVRAQAMVESSWHQTSVAGFVLDEGTCFGPTHRRPLVATTTTGLPSTSSETSLLVPAETQTTSPKEAPTTSTVVGAQQFECPTAFGIMQLRADYQPGTYPLSANSTAYNLDYALAMQRSCVEGVSWLGAQAKGDVWACVGSFYSGNFRDAAAEQYIAKVQNAQRSRSWLRR